MYVFVCLFPSLWVLLAALIRPQPANIIYIYYIYIYIYNNSSHSRQIGEKGFSLFSPLTLQLVSEVGFCWFCHLVPQRASNLVPRTPSSDHCGLTMAGRGQGILVARGRSRPVPIRTEHAITRSMARARANINNVEDYIVANDPDLEVLTGANGSDPRSSEESGSESAFENVDGGQPAGLTSTPSSPTITRQPDDYVSRRDFEVLQRRIDSLVDYLHTNNRTPRVRRRLPQTHDVSSRISPRQNVVDSGVVAGN